MANKRSINTNFWKDSYVIELDPTEKLLFMYLLTNPLTNLVGIYEISIREIAFDTGIDKDMVTKLLQRFEKDKKIIYTQNWVVMRNWQKHQRLNKNMQIGAAKLLENLPDWLKNEIENGKQMSLTDEQN